MNDYFTITDVSNPLGDTREPFEKYGYNLDKKIKEMSGSTNSTIIYPQVFSGLRGVQTAGVVAENYIAPTRVGTNSIPSNILAPKYKKINNVSAIILSISAFPIVLEFPTGPIANYQVRIWANIARFLPDNQLTPWGANFEPVLALDLGLLQWNDFAGIFTWVKPETSGFASLDLSNPISYRRYNGGGTSGYDFSNVDEYSYINKITRQQYDDLLNKNASNWYVTLVYNQDLLSLAQSNHFNANLGGNNGQTSTMSVSVDYSIFGSLANFAKSSS